MNIKIPVSWLRDYLKTDLAAKTIANYLTASGPSVERMEKKGEDFIFDIEVTTNRPDAFSVLGIAREAHAILSSNGQKSELTAPKGMDLQLDPDTTSKVTLDAQITDSKLCPRFTAIVLEVKIQESPALIKNRLIACDIRPINNIVDITNYIMLETGQPMHAFDFDKIEGAKMVLRQSRQYEKITTLDSQKRILPKGAIVIQDSKKLVDLCGIMGGENSQISKRTKRAIFFVQAYDPFIIRRTTQALAFRTDAATRFEKGVDLENILPTLSRSVYLAKKIAGAKIISELIDIYPKKQESKTTTLRFSKLNKYLGIEINPTKTIQILTSLGFKTHLEISQIKAVAPSWRTNDIDTDVDLIEEIARIYGYHNLPSTLPVGQVPNRQDSDLKKVIALKNALKYLGQTEVITYSIISKEMLGTTGVSEKKAVELTNPLTEEWQFMRPTLISSLTEVVAKNSHLKSAISIFEIAKTYLKQKSGLPVQDLFLTIVQSNGDFYKIKGITENVFEALGQKATYSKIKDEDKLFQANQSATVKIGDTQVGKLGLLNSAITDHFELQNQISAVELNLSRIYNLSTLSKSFHAISKFSPVIEDISAIFSIYTPLGDITLEIKKISTLVKNIEVIDIFEDPKLGDLKKSVTLRLTYQKQNSTPTQQEVNGERTKIIKSLETNLRAKVRK